MNIWDNAGYLEMCDAKRAQQRRIRYNSAGKNLRLTFDCLNCKYNKNLPDRCYCACGIKLGTAQNGSMDLVSVLRGRTALVCRTCVSFNG